MKKTVIISGGMGGVGQAIAKRLAPQYQVALLYHRTSAAEAEAFVKTLSGEGHRAYQCDLTEESHIETVIPQITSDHPDVFGCVHTATGPLVRKKLSELSTKEFQDHFAVDVIGGFSLMRACAKLLMEKKDGVIIAITSTFAEMNQKPPRLGAYVPGKFALRGVLREFATELAPYHVRVNAVSPNVMQTNLSADLPERVFEFAKEKNPMHALLTPDDVAGVVAFLCSDDARAITGVLLPISYGEVQTL